jgi:adenylate cyclase
MSGEGPESREGQAPTSPAAAVQPPPSGTNDGASHAAGHVHAHQSPVQFRFLEQLKHRNVIRVGILYLVVCWLILDPIHVLFHMLDVPVWANRLVVILMSVGFPAVLLFAWVYEVTPEGLKPTADVDPHRSIRRQTGQRLNRAIVVVMAVALAYFAIDKFWLSKHVTAEPSAIPTAYVGPATTPAVSDKSIAVLPFVDMSEKKDQEYFADGMAEEILDLLAKIPELRVIGRTSSFSFKGRNEDLRAIGEKLRTTYVVEGSVRKSGDRIRIAAQLVDARDGAHLWSGTYDRGFGEVLALQDQIASAIARALQLAVGADDTREARHLENADAYTFYLRGRSAIDRGDAGVREAKTDFEQALALDPTFVKGAEALALAHVEEIGGVLVSSHVGWPAAKEACERVLQLDPKSALAHALLGLELATYNYDWSGANAELDKTLALSPRDPYALYISAWLAFDLGRHDEAVRLQDAALAIDPLNPDSHQNGAYLHYLMGDLDGAERAFRTSLEISPTFEGNHRMLGEILLQRGQAAAALVEMQAELGPEPFKDIGLALAYHALGRREESDAALAGAKRGHDKVGAFNIALVYAYRGERDQAFEWLERAVSARDLNLGHRFKYDPLLDSLRGDPRYKALLRKMNLPDDP